MEQNIDFRESVSRELKNFDLEYKKEGAAENKEGVYYFISFDLVNSTSYKYKYLDDWLKVNKDFYTQAVYEINNYVFDEENSRKIELAEVWRYLGDEIILFLKIYDSEQLFYLTEATFNVTKKLINFLEKRYKNTKNFLSVKSAVWVAKLSPESFSSENESICSSGECINIIDEMGYERNFLGPDIDAGFRMKAYSYRGKLSVCAQLSYLLYIYSKKDDKFEKYRIEDKLKIIDYKKLKGVWGERLYPIIWYYNDWNTIGRDFYYDEEIQYDLVKKAIGKDRKPIIEIGKILSDLNYKDKLKNIENCIDSMDYKTDISAHILRPEKSSEVHCTATCFNEEGKILLGQRPTQKKLGGKWQFGCAQLKFQESFEKCLKTAYLDDFNINIEVLTKYPICTFSFKEKKLPGIRFIAKTTNSKDEIKLNENHSDYKWFDLEELENESFNEDDYIPEFKETVSLAQAAYTRWRNETSAK